ncbi:MAG TPA: hypothetical protein VMF56_00635 [Acidobacteriaceae bacterium]|nr:hypothetical protein [Acidobacteriaceae bacterium]
MLEAGVLGITPAQDLRYYFNYHHTTAATLDKVNPRPVAENAAVIAVTAYALADRSNFPPALSAHTRNSGSGNIQHPDLSDTDSSLPAPHRAAWY